ncbi:MAG: Gfo/Idh/MocA family oxidoreductase [Kiritimatiellia bacterium]|jgi:predicted dehydrogenase|nr:Gfo/Idh/MocA family oxidoreductase [Kiritimatiellia bacterium]
MKSTGRRDFLKAALATSAVGVAPFNIQAAGPSPNSKLNIVGVGIGRMGSNNLKTLAGHNIIGVADPDEAWSRRHYPAPKVKHWRDYRRMFDDIGKEIDGVVTATPEHARYAACMYFIKRGKHVYAQKPLCHTVNEARILYKESKKHKVVTQMGNQGHSTGSTALIRDWIKAGSIGKVTEVIGYSRKNYWTKVKPVDGSVIPETLDWDLWLNRAEKIPFSTSYMNREWIRYSHFSGVVGDMATHILDPANYSLELGPPISVEAKVEDSGFPGSLPKAGVVTWEFPARGEQPPVTMKYYVGPDIEYPRPKRLEEGRRASFMGSGSVMVGEKASIFAGSHSQSPRIFPEATMKATPKPPEVSERNKGRNHEGNWTKAIIDGGKAMSDFGYACPFTETLVLGDVALLHPGRKLLWDTEKMKITNDEEADKSMFMRRLDPRDNMGWI